MKIFSMVGATVFAALLFCGCGESPLKYVEKSADKVEYGNTEALLSDKGQNALKQGLIDSVFLSEMKELLGEDKALKLNITYARWSEIGKDKQLEPVGAVIVVNEGGAQELFDDLRKAYRKAEKTVKKEEVGEDKNTAFVVYSDAEGKKIEKAYVLADDDTIHVVYGDDPKIFKKDGDNKFAEMIDTDATFAGAESKDDETIGEVVVKGEVFFTDDEIKSNVTNDITKVKDAKKK